MTDGQRDAPPGRLQACPCCGRKTLHGLGEDDICGVCWWHDDGQDNVDADEVRGGPNSDLSLTQARFNALIYGISNPRRTDLMSQREPAETFEAGRTFVLSLDGAEVREPATGWEGRVFSAGSRGRPTRG
jgi:hypothetical protein